MELKGNKKIILLLAVALIIIAGIVVVALKGFNVSLLYHQHESIKLFIGKEVNLDEIDTICKEVFENQKYEVRTVEVFKTSVNISFESITDEQLASLISIINDKYGTNFVTTDSSDDTDATVVTINENGNVRLRDMINPYIVPTIISTVIIAIYMLFRFRKLDLTKVFSNIIVKEILVMAVALSLIAILRLPMEPLTINLIFVLSIVVLLVFIANREKDLKTLQKAAK